MHEIYFGPLQGYTDYIYRNLHQKYFGGVSKYFTPYLRFEPNKLCKKSVLNDLHPDNNLNQNIVPQVLGTDINKFINVCKIIQDWGYKEINWNLGCPYPMVTKRGYGSGILNNPEKVDKILDTILKETNLNFSIKCRLGFENENEIFDLLKVYNKYPLSEVTIHTRTAKQMYKGFANPDSFNEIIKESKHKLIYNGDIINPKDLNSLDNKFVQNINSWMIGRGLLQNPFLAKEINGEILDSNFKKEMFEKFYYELFEAYNSKLQPSHILMRMQTHWEYFSFLFENQRKVYKSIKKAKSIFVYEQRVKDIFKSSYIYNQ